MWFIWYGRLGAQAWNIEKIMYKIDFYMEIVKGEIGMHGFKNSGRRIWTTRWYLVLNFFVDGLEILNHVSFEESSRIFNLLMFEFSRKCL